MKGIFVLNAPKSNTKSTTAFKYSFVRERELIEIQIKIVKQELKQDRVDNYKVKQLPLIDPP